MLLPIAAVFAVGVLVLSLIQALLRNFVAPLMYRFDARCLEAWKIFGQACRGNIGRIILFFLIRLAYLIPMFFMMCLGGCLTCCIGFIPVIRESLFAPLYVFDRAYSLCVIGSLGPEFQIIGLEEPDNALSQPEAAQRQSPDRQIPTSGGDGPDADAGQ
jgi:hypothetical protein